MNYYIQGDAANADKIKAAFEKKGYSDKGFTFDVDDILFFTANNKHINVCPADGWLANIIKTHPDYKELELPVEPKFKVGDEIKTGNTIETIAEIGHAIRSYYCESGRTISFENQDLWHLAPKPHYDIANFQPKQWVLVRQGDVCAWRLDIFSNLKEGTVCQFECVGNSMVQCIPFNEETKHLLGTTDMPSEEYINW